MVFADIIKLAPGYQQPPCPFACNATMTSNNATITCNTHKTLYLCDAKWHDDVIKWKHFLRYWPGDRWIPLTKGQWHGALMFSLTCAWTNGWANNRDAGDLRRHCACYDVMVIDVLVHIGLVMAYLPLATNELAGPIATYWWLDY